MFKVGTYVSYRSEGVCVISDIRMEAFNALGKSEEFYILAPIKDMNSVLYVPVNNEVLTSKMIFPAIVLSIVTISFYIIGNAFADAADPKNHV